MQDRTLSSLGTISEMLPSCKFFPRGSKTQLTTKHGHVNSAVQKNAVISNSIYVFNLRDSEVCIILGQLKRAGSQNHHLKIRWDTGLNYRLSIR